MKKILGAILITATTVLGSVPAAHAGGATNAALGLGAFAVFNQLVRGETVFQGLFGPPPVVVQQPVVVAAPPVVVAPPPPVIVAPPPVVVALPPPVVYYAPAPTYYRPAPVVPGYYKAHVPPGQYKKMRGHGKPYRPY